MDHDKSPPHRHRCVQHQSESCANTGNSNIFYTTRLCEKLVLPKADFDLTDPNGYKLDTAYNCLHDPNLKAYLYRRDIHKHLLQDGFITKEDRVTCSLKEFNTYKKYLKDIQLDMDHRFKMKQKGLVRKILLLQEEGKISSDICLPDFMEWLMCNGKAHLRSGISSDRRSRTSGDALRLPEMNRHVKLLPSRNRSQCDDDVCKARQRQILKEVTEEVKREIRLERRWRDVRREREQQGLALQRKKWRESKAALRAKTQFGSNTNIMHTSLKEGKALSQESLLRRGPILRNLSPLPYAQKAIYSNVAVSAMKPKLLPRLTSNRSFDNKDVSGTESLQMITQETPLSKLGDIFEDVRTEVTTVPPSHEISTPVTLNNSNANEKQPEDLTDVINLAINDMMNILIPTLKEFIQEQISSKKSPPNDSPFSSFDHLSPNVCDISHHISSASVEPSSDLLKRAEKIIWEAIHGAVEQVKDMESSTGQREEPESRVSFSQVISQDLTMSKSCKPTGFYGGDKAATNTESVSLTNINAENDLLPCGGQVFKEAEGARAEKGDEGSNVLKSQILMKDTCSSKCNSSSSLNGREQIYSQFVDEILVRVYSLVDETSRTPSAPLTRMRRTPSSSSSSSSSRKHIKFPSMQTDQSRSGPTHYGGQENNNADSQGNTCPSHLVGLSVGPQTTLPVSPGGETTASETGLCADEMVRDIMDTLTEGRELRSAETKHSEAVSDSSMWTEDSLAVSPDSEGLLDTHFSCLPARISPSQVQQEAVDISHQIFLNIKKQIEEGCENDSDHSGAFEKETRCEFVDSALAKLRHMQEPQSFFITQGVDMLSSLSDDFQRGEPSHQMKCPKASEMIENVKVQFEKAAQKPVKAILQSSLRNLFCFDSSVVETASTKNMEACVSQQRDGSNNERDLSSLTSDITMTVWGKMVEVLGWDTCAVSHGDEENLKDLIRSVYELLPIHPVPVKRDRVDLQAEFVLEEIKHDIETKLMQFISKQSEGDQAGTGSSVVRKTTRPLAVSELKIDHMSGDVATESNNKQVTNTCGEDGSTAPLCSVCKLNSDKRPTYSASQITCCSSPDRSSALDHFPGILSKSAMSLLKDSYGEQASSLKVRVDASPCLADPTFESFVVQPHVNQKDLIVHRVAVEELSPLRPSCSLDNNRHENTPQTPSRLKSPEVCSVISSESKDIKEEASERLHRSQMKGSKDPAGPSPAMLHLFKPIVERLVCKVIDMCMLGSELIMRQGKSTFETLMLKKRRIQSARCANDLKGIPEEPQMSDTTKERCFESISLKRPRPHTAGAGQSEAQETFGPRDPVFRSKLEESFTTSSSTPLDDQEMFWKKFQRAQPASDPKAEESVKGPSPALDDALTYQDDGYRVNRPLPSGLDTSKPMPQMLAETVKDIMARFLVSVFNDPASGAASPLLDLATSNLRDRVLLQMLKFHLPLFEEIDVKKLSSTHLDKRHITRCVYQDMVFYCGGIKRLQRGISSCDRQTLEKLAISLVQSLTKSFEDKDYISEDNVSIASTRLSSMRSTALSSPISWVTEEACTISEDITLRSVELLTEKSSICSLDIAEDLMDAVMVELYTDPDMFGTPRPESVDWPQLSLSELNDAATVVYKHMLEQCGTVENLQKALQSRDKQAVTTMAVAIASQTYKLISMKDSSASPIMDIISNRTGSRSKRNTPKQSPEQSFVSYQTVWDVISTLMLEVFSKKSRGQHLTPKLFLKSLSILSEHPGLRIGNDKTLCDLSTDANAIERIVLRSRQRLYEHIEYRRDLESLLVAKDEAATERVVVIVVEEILKSLSRPFKALSETSRTQSPLSHFGYQATHDADLNNTCDNQFALDGCSLTASVPENFGRVISENISRDSHQSKAISSKRVTWPDSMVSYLTKVTSKTKSSMSDEPVIQSVSQPRTTKVIGAKVKKRSRKGRPAKRRPLKSEDANEEKSSGEEKGLSFGSFLSKLFR